MLKRLWIKLRFIVRTQLSLFLQFVFLLELKCGLVKLDVSINCKQFDLALLLQRHSTDIYCLLSELLYDKATKSSWIKEVSKLISQSTKRWNYLRFIACGKWQLNVNISYQTESVSVNRFDNTGCSYTHHFSLIFNTHLIPIDT